MNKAEIVCCVWGGLCAVNAMLNASQGQGVACLVNGLSVALFAWAAFG